MRELLHPRMLEELADFYPSTCSFQSNEATRDPDSGERLPSSWQDVSGHTDLACQIAPNGGQEVKQADETIEISDFTISFPSDQTDVTPSMQAVVTGNNAGTYDVVLVQRASHGDLTRVLVRKVS